MIDDSGRVMFNGGLIGPGVTAANQRGVWMETDGGITLLARQGDQVARAPSGVVYNGFQRYSMNQQGTVAMVVSLAGASVTGNNDLAIVLGPQESLEKVVREGDPAPGDGTLGQPNSISFSLNENGKIAFLGSRRLAEGGERAAIYFGDATGVQRVVETGQEAPGFEDGRVFSHLFLGDAYPALNDQNKIAFTTSLAPGAGQPPLGLNSQIWIAGENGELDTAVESGDVAPWIHPGVVFAPPNLSFGRVSMNNQGDIAFTGRVENISGDPLIYSTGVWKRVGDEIELIAHESQTGFETFTSAVNWPRVDQVGNVTFQGSLNDETVVIGRGGIWNYADGQLDNVALEGGAAPGIPGGTFDDISNLDSLPSFPVINDRGQIAFRAQIEGSVSDGLWATDLDGVLQPVALPGDLVEVAPGVFKVIDGVVDFAGDKADADGRPSGINHWGEVVFVARFTDFSSAILVSTAVANFPLPGDYDSNGIVDMQDHTYWKQRFGSNSEPSADGNGDGVVNAADYTIWRDAFGDGSSGSSAAVPEPNVMAILVWALGAAAMVARRGEGNELIGSPPRVADQIDRRLRYSSRNDLRGG